MKLENSYWLKEANIVVLLFKRNILTSKGHYEQLKDLEFHLLTTNQVAQKDILC